jgi:hypothetical protein
MADEEVLLDSIAEMYGAIPLLLYKTRIITALQEKKDERCNVPWHETPR